MYFGNGCAIQFAFISLSSSFCAHAALPLNLLWSSGPFSLSCNTSVMNMSVELAVTSPLREGCLKTHATTRIFW